MVPVAGFAMMTLVGLALALDLGGVSTIMAGDVRRWWTAGPIRRKLHSPWHEKFRLFGVLLTLGSLLGLIASIVGVLRGDPLH